MKLRSLLVVFVAGLAVLAGSYAGTFRKVARPEKPSVSVAAQEPVKNEVKPEKSKLEEDWGIKVESTTLSAGDYMIDFRFRVLDAAKAAQIFDRRIMPQMIDQATGATFIVPSPPKVGQLRSGGNIKEGKIYYIFFANPAKYVKSGSKITIEIGDFKIQDIVVN